jgi:RNA polymerase sigma factor (sigma-70 family)
MAFPNTRLSLIERLAEGGGVDDWRTFLDDYWGPVCRFARQHASLSVDDAEDVAAETLEAIVKNKLLARWSAERSAKLRTLICTVVRNVLSNRGRLAGGRARLVREHGGQLDRYVEGGEVRGDLPDSTTDDQFYAAWADDLVQQTVEGLLLEYGQAGCLDRFRVLFGRLCEAMPMTDIAAALKTSPAAVDSQFRQARERLTERLQEMLRGRVNRYSSDENADDEFSVEWGRLGQYLQQHGGLEAAVRRSHGQLEYRL